MKIFNKHNFRKCVQRKNEQLDKALGWVRHVSALITVILDNLSPVAFAYMHKSF